MRRIDTNNEHKYAAAGDSMSLDKYVRKSIIGYSGPALEQRHGRFHDGQMWAVSRIIAAALRRVREEAWTPAATLMFAVYEQALDDAFFCVVPARTQQGAVRFLLTDASDVCLWSIGIDPEYARRIIEEAFDGSVPMTTRKRAAA